jgi:glucose/arabinose dehydrogenase
MNLSRRRTLTKIAAGAVLALTAGATASQWSSARLEAQGGPTLLDSNLAVRIAISGLTLPTGIAFLGDDEFLVTEKASGQVKHVMNGAVAGTALDLAVNSNSERGLLSIALDPDFGRNNFVYLYWTCTATPPVDPALQTVEECDDTPVPGADTDDVLAVPVLGNRVDRFMWDGVSLTFERNLIKLRAFQNDITNGRARGNHNGGVIRFGPDGNLYIMFGDNGRRGQMQNLVDGPVGPGVPDDQFGGPEPDNAHFTGVIIRLEPDGTTPPDNPFFQAGANIAGEAGANIQKIFAYGVRNSFGMAFDPVSGQLWDQQNGDDSFDELNRVEAGQNLGWVQVMGPLNRIAQWKAIETSEAFLGLQQVRWPPTLIADSPAEAQSRLFMLPGATYSDPEFSWRFAVAPAAIGFQNGRELGPQYSGDLFVGASTPSLDDGYLFHFNLAGNRRAIGVDDPRLEDRVADNAEKFSAVESETLRFGTGFGISTHIETGPNGNLFVVSLSNGTVYEIRRNR